MGREIERKFLLADESWRPAVSRSMRMRQGYLANNERVSVRIRICGEEARLNVKSAGLAAARDEFEYPVPSGEAEFLLDVLAERPLIDKTRHIVTHEGFVWEIDEFHADNDGLVVAEIELDSLDQAFPRPAWLGSEVTHLLRYYNVSLVKSPYSCWSQAERAP